MATAPQHPFPVAGGARFVGSRVQRTEDPRLLTGATQYTSDVSLPGMLSACFVRAETAHARIGTIQTNAALAVPGVVAVLTAADLDAVALDHQMDIPGLVHTPQPVLASEKARFLGEPVALVVATSRYVAEDGAERVRVGYEELDPVVDVHAAMSADAPLLFETLGTNVLFDETKRSGDVEAAFAAADRIVKASYHTNRFVAAPMEGRALVADPPRHGGELTVWCSTQTPFLLRTTLAAILGFPEGRMRVIAPDVGGGFGQKMSTYPEEAAVVAAALRLGRPVSWVEDRRENLVAATHAKEQEIELEAAVSADGVLLGMRATHVGDAGAYSVNNVSSLIEPAVGARNLPGLYRLPAYEWRIVSVATNRSPVGAYRAVGSTAGSLARDLLFARIARELGMDVADFLRRNVLRPDDMPYRSATGQLYDSGSHLEATEKALEMVGYEHFRKRQRELRGEGRYIGIGIAPFIEATGWGSELASMQEVPFPSHDNATVSIDPSGHVTVATSMADHGQGHATAFAQVAADIIGVDMADVTVRQGDTGRSPYGMGTFASRSAVIGGGSVTLAAHEVREKLLTVAGRLLEASPDDLVIDGGAIAVTGAPETAISVRDVAGAAYFHLGVRDDDESHVLSAKRFYDPPATFANGCFVATVEVDTELGLVKIDRIVGVEDCGVVINPLIVEGQSHGAVAQSVGGALLEEIIYDEHGQILTASYLDYLLPTALDVPRMDIGHLETPAPNTVGGVKGMGEGGLMSAPSAIACAVADALEPMGADVTRLPLKPERVLELIDGA